MPARDPEADRRAEEELDAKIPPYVPPSSAEAGEDEATENPLVQPSEGHDAEEGAPS